MKWNAGKEDRMKIALSVFKDSISTVFDAADAILIVEADGANKSKHVITQMRAACPAVRAAQLKAQDIDVLICGAISRPMEAAIIAAGIAVHPFICGPVEDVIAAYQSGLLNRAVFSLPGCHRPVRGGRRRGRGIQCLRRQTASVNVKARRRFPPP